MKVLISEKLSPHKYKTPEGYLICVDAVLARTGKQSYRRSEIFADAQDDDTEIEVDRKPEEVFSKETLASFENKPVTVEHPDVDVNSENIKDYAVGFVRDVHKGVVDGQEVILGTLVIQDAQTIQEIEDGEHTDLSCGYDCDIVDEANPEQKHIRGNHVALCAQGRAGNARIVDSKKVKDSLTKEEKELIDYAIDNLDHHNNANRLIELMRVYYSAYADLARRKPDEVKEYFKENINDSIKDSIKDSYYTIGGYYGKYDPIAQKDIKQASKYGVDGRIERINGGYQLVLHGEKNNLINCLENYFGVDASGLKDSIKDSILGKKVIIRPRDVRMNKYVDEKGIIYSYEGTHSDDMVEVKLNNGQYVEVRYDEIKFIDSIKDDASFDLIKKFIKLKFNRDYNFNYKKDYQTLKNSIDNYFQEKVSDDLVWNVLRYLNSNGYLTFSRDSIKDVNPREGESKEDFISRFMSETKNEYPDEKQRLAVAYSYWEKRNMKDIKDDTYTIQYHNGKWYYEIKYNDGFTKLVGPYNSAEEARTYFKKHRPNEKLSDEESTHEEVTKSLEKDFEKFKEARMRDNERRIYTFTYKTKDGFTEKFKCQAEDGEDARNQLQEWAAMRDEEPYKIISTNMTYDSIRDAKVLIRYDTNAQANEAVKILRRHGIDADMQFDTTIVINHASSKDIEYAYDMTEGIATTPKHYDDSCKDAKEYRIGFYNSYTGKRALNNYTANSVEEALKEFAKDMAIHAEGIANVYVNNISPNDGYVKLYGKLNELLKTMNINIYDSCKDSRKEEILKELDELERQADWADDHNNPGKVIEIQRQIDKLAEELKSIRDSKNHFAKLISMTKIAKTFKK